ncbi:MAG: outer membrane beta-barrel protein [Gammaproteobacteria bacterium]|nr:outer membrane beta-barrel protein [Gammaproteobacteria bacterium]
MKNPLMAALAAVFTFTLALSANAQTNYDQYWGAGLGSTDSDQCSGIAACDDTAAGVKLFYGRDLHNNFAFETGWAYNGGAAFTFAGNRNEALIQSVFGDAVGKLPIGERVTLFAKVGAHYWFLQNEYQGGDDDDNGIGLHFGLGGDFQIDDRNGIRVEFERFKAKPTANVGVGNTVVEVEGDFDIDRFGVSYIRRF